MIYVFVFKIGEQATTPPVQIAETEEEENSYNLDEITSQFYEDETTHIDCRLSNKSPEKPHHDEVSDNTEDCSSRDNGETNFTKVLDISHEIEKLNESLLPSHGNKQQKRQKIKQ